MLVAFYALLCDTVIMQAEKGTIEREKKPNRFLAALNEAIELRRKFHGDPRDFLPCLECGEPIPHGKITDLNHMLHSVSCKRRFVARMRADGRNPELVLEQAHTDAFGIARGSVPGRMMNTEALPDREVLLLKITRHLWFTREKHYLATRGWFTTV